MEIIKILRPSLPSSAQISMALSNKKSAIPPLRMESPILLINIATEILDWGFRRSEFGVGGGKKRENLRESEIFCNFASQLTGSRPVKPIKTIHF